MENRWLHRYAIAVAACTLFLVAAGASVTSNEAGLSVPDWPLSYGKVMPEMTGGIFYEHGHRMVAATVGLLTIILAVWLWKADERAWMRKLGFAALGAVVAQGLLGGMTVIFLLPKAVSISHASLAQIFFSTTVAIALFTSPAWRQGPVVVNGFAGGAHIRAVAAAAPVLVLAQLALGAGYRHKAFGIVPHVIGAVVVTGVILYLAITLLTLVGAHRALRQAAMANVWAAFIQVFLGVAAYMSRVATADAPQPMPVMVWFTVLHVAVGALTLAATVITAIQVLRNVRTAEAVAEGAMA